MVKFPDSESIVALLKKEKLPSFKRLLRKPAFLRKAAFLLLGAALCQAAFLQTVRSAAEERFSAFGWIEKAKQEDVADSGEASGRGRAVRRFELSAASSDAASPLSQDTGAFPVAPLASLMQAKTAPPLLPGAGSLDFSAAPLELVGLFRSLSLSLKACEFSGIKAAASSSFIPILLEYMMRRLPQPEDVWFAGIATAQDGMSARAVFKLSFPAAAEPVFALAEALFEEGEWKVVDVIFDDDSYEKAAKQAGM